MPSTAPFVQGSDTSFAAALAIEPHLNRLEKLVYEQVQQAGARGATDEELRMRLGLKHETVSARRRELVLKGVVCDSGQRRATPSRRSAIAWVLGKEENIIEGAASDRPLHRPSAEDLSEAANFLERSPFENLQRVSRWLRYLSSQGPK